LKVWLLELIRMEKLYNPLVELVIEEFPKSVVSVSKASTWEHLKVWLLELILMEKLYNPLVELLLEEFLKVRQSS
jgi:hypothetical protein